MMNMKFVFTAAVVFAALIFSVNLVAAHGDEGTAESSSMMDSSAMMSGMMDMMHGSIDANKTLNCDELSDDEMMEHGEEMMEQMMGHETHEKVEEAMTPDVHDNTHTMMGMWATGCVGDETMSALMARYGISQGGGTAARQEIPAQAGWAVVGLGVIIGVIGGWMGSQMFGKKS